MDLQKQIDQLLSDQASHWLEVLKTAGAKEQAAFHQWLSQSRRHMEEFLEVVALEQALGDLDLERRIDVDALIAQLTPAVTPLRTPAATRPMSRRRWRPALAAAAAIAAVSTAAAMYLSHIRSADDVITPAGTLRTVSLQDGSVMTVNGSSHVRIDYSRQERKVELLKGEAVFRVAREASRPFQVYTPTAIVRAVGTQFNVNQQPTGTVVTVLEGRVRVVAQLQDQPGLAAPVEPGIQDLKAGEAAQVQPTGLIQKSAAPDVAQAVAWQRRSLKFEETPLQDIVAAINRHSAVKLRLESADIGRQRYGGIFDGSDPESLAAVLEREPDLVVERRANEIVVRRR